jgi:hypothetical protein
VATKRYVHIDLTPEGVAYISGTTLKLAELVLEHVAYAWEAPQLQRQHPYLSLGQIHSALAYYYDHQPDLDRQIQEDLRRIEEIRASLGESPNRARLRAARQRS